MASFTVIKGISDFADPPRTPNIGNLLRSIQPEQLRFMIEEEAITPESDG